MEGRIDYLLEGRRDLRQRMRASERKRCNTRDRDELLIRKIYKSEGMMR